MEIGSAFPLEEELAIEVRGRDMVDGMPKTIQLTSVEVREALSEPIAHIVSRTRSVLEQTPPELSADIVSHGIWLTGGGALLRGLDQLLHEQTGIKVHIAEDPLSCVAIGTGQALDHIELLSETHFQYAGLEA
jgi:rod shape-determining protein MreB